MVTSRTGRAKCDIGALSSPSADPPRHSLACVAHHMAHLALKVCARDQKRVICMRVRAVACKHAPTRV